MIIEVDNKYVFVHEGVVYIKRTPNCATVRRGKQDSQEFVGICARELKSEPPIPPPPAPKPEERTETFGI